MSKSILVWKMVFSRDLDGSPMMSMHPLIRRTTVETLKIGQNLLNVWDNENSTAKYPNNLSAINKHADSAADTAKI